LALPGDSSDDEDAAAAAWQSQANRLLGALAWPPEAAVATGAATGALAARVTPPEGSGPRAAEFLVAWALEAAGRVLRGAPQPTTAEVYKAARAIRGLGSASGPGDA